MLTAYGQQVLNWMMLRRFNRIEGSDTTFIIQNNGWNCRITGPITSRRIRLSGETHLHPSLMLFALRVQHLSTATVSVSADVTDDGTVAAVELQWGTAPDTFTSSIGMTEAKGTYVTDADIPAQANGTTVYYRIYAEDNEEDFSYSPTYSYTVRDPATATVPYLEDFATGLGIAIPTVCPETQIMEPTCSGYVYMNGHNSGDGKKTASFYPHISTVMMI